VSISKKGSCWWVLYHVDYLQKYMFMDDASPGHEVTKEEQETCAKQARMMLAQGQEIEGPGYSVHACGDVDRLENRSMQCKEFP
jgi:hypothetical protein